MIKELNGPHGIFCRKCFQMKMYRLWGNSDENVCIQNVLGSRMALSKWPAPISGHPSVKLRLKFGWVGEGVGGRIGSVQN